MEDGTAGLVGDVSVQYGNDLRLDSTAFYSTIATSSPNVLLNLSASALYGMCGLAVPNAAIPEVAA
ncbi:hypothetical protein GCM10028807_12180 [Spirosoma daeguense]